MIRGAVGDAARAPLVVDVVIPALDEARSIGLVLAAIPPGLVRRVVVADNGSSDGTPQVAAASGAVVVHEPRRGYGSACLCGLALLEADPPEVVVFLDGDFSDYPEDLPDLLAPIASGEAELVVGSRTTGRAEPGALLPQARFGNRLACWLMARFHGGPRFTDLGPFRAITWSALERLGMRDPDFGWTVEMQVKALRHGVRATEVPVRYRRRVGVSKVTGTLRGTVLAGTKILWTIFRYSVLPVVAEALRHRPSRRTLRSRAARLTK